MISKIEQDNYKIEFEKFWNSIFHGVFVDLNRKPKNQKVHSVTHSSPHLLLQDIVSFKLTGSDVAVLGEALKYCDDKNHVLLIVNQVAGRLSLQPDTVKKSITKLVKLGMIERLTNQIYLVDPVYIWRGTEGDRMIALRKRMLKAIDTGRLVVDEGIVPLSD